MSPLPTKSSVLQCVAPITRAVDDHTAMTLCLDAFKRQVALDCQLGSITFICSKTNDIGITEAHATFGLDSKVEEEIGRGIDIIDARIEAIRTELRNLEDERDKASGDDAHVTEYSLRLEEAFTENTASLQPGHKRNTSMDSGSLSAKDSLHGDVRAELSAVTPIPEMDDDVISSSNMTVDQLKQEQRDISCKRKLSFSRTKIIQSRIADLSKELKQYEHARLELEHEPSHLCIIERNERSREHIQLDFAIGVKQLGKETAAAREDTTDPFVSAGDYDTLAQSLSVFCVSARAYQKLQGRMKWDNPIKGYTYVEDTEIPQLRKHSIDSTVATRIAASEAFVNGLEQLLNSLRLRTSEQVMVRRLSKEQNQQDLKSLDETLTILRKEIEKALKDIFDRRDEASQTLIFDHLTRAAENAVETLWNLKKLAENLHKLFQNEVPAILDDLANTLIGHLGTFYLKIKAYVSSKKEYAPKSAALDVQFRTTSRSCREMTAAAKVKIAHGQRGITRDLSPDVQSALLETYKHAGSITGPGTYCNMKEIIGKGVEQMKKSMFSNGTQRMENDVRRIPQVAHEDSIIRMNEIVEDLSPDYSIVFKRSRDSGENAFYAEMAAFIEEVPAFCQHS
ncbi:hypothetical protein VTO42DRAFT_22 [Malbranchea cinnamomea]